MAKGYWVANIDVMDMDGYKAYVAAPVPRRCASSVQNSLSAAESPRRSRASCVRAWW